MDFTYLLIAGTASISTGLFLYWFVYTKKQPTVVVENKSLSNELNKKKSITSKISKYKELILKIKHSFAKHKIIPFSSYLYKIVQPILYQCQMIFQKNRLTKQDKAEKSLLTFAKYLWDKGIYSEAERLNREAINIKNLQVKNYIRDIIE